MLGMRVSSEKELRRSLWTFTGTDLFPAWLLNLSGSASDLTSMTSRMSHDGSVVVRGGASGLGSPVQWKCYFIKWLKKLTQRNAALSYTLRNEVWRLLKAF